MSSAGECAARFDQGAHAYAKMWAPVLAPFGRRLIADLDISRARSVLEIASGVGMLLPLLRAAAPGARIVASDFSPGMLDLAPPKFDRVACDAARLAFAGASFDAAIMAFALFLVADTDAALREALRVLRPSGAFAMTSWKGRANFAAHEVWQSELLAHGGSIAPWAADAIEPEALERAFLRCGFESVKVRVGRFDYRHDPRRFFELRTAMMRPWIDTLQPEARVSFHSNVRARLAALQSDGWIDTTEIIYARARAPAH